jgi:hypothetical protein
MGLTTGPSLAGERPGAMGTLPCYQRGCDSSHAGERGR